MTVQASNELCHQRTGTYTQQARPLSVASGRHRYGLDSTLLNVNIFGSTSARRTRSGALRKARVATSDLSHSLLPLPDVPATSTWQVFESKKSDKIVCPSIPTPTGNAVGLFSLAPAPLR